MYSNKKNTGWVLCPSKSFPGKFYYFNVATGETAWCLSEAEDKSIRNPPLQQSDHCYPEPTSPPNQGTPMSNHHQSNRFSPHHERTICNYPLESSNYQNMSGNELMHPYPQEFRNALMSGYPQEMSNYPNIPQNLTFPQRMMPYQIQLPMVWPSDGNVPQVVMIVMNQAMKQLAIDEPRPGYRHVPAFQSNQTWNEPYANWQHPKQVQKEPYQNWQNPKLAQKELYQNWQHPKQVQKEPYQNWQHPKQVQKEPYQNWQHSKQTLNEPYQNWKQPKQPWTNPNLVQTHSKEPDRELFVHTGKAPLSERFVNYKKTNVELNDKTNVCNSNQNLTKSNQPTCNQNQKTNNLECSKPVNQQKTMFRPPIFNFAKNDTDNSNLSFQFTKKTNTNPTPITNNNVSNQRKPFIDKNQGRSLFTQNQVKSLFDCQTNPIFGQSQPKQVFGQTQTNSDHTFVFGQSHTDKYANESQNSTNICLSEVQEPKSFQKLAKQKSTLEQTTKVDIQSPKINSKIPTLMELNITPIVKENLTLELENKVETSQELDPETLHENDLRRVLIEKKRKAQITDKSNITDAKKIRTSKQENTDNNNAPKKKVTFNMDLEEISQSEHENDYQDMDCQEVTSQNETWYVVSDAVTLLKEFAALNHFVRSDPKCNLVIPSQAMSEIVTLSRGESRERQIVTQARQLMRTLAAPQPQVIIQQSGKVANLTADDSILNCCLEIMDKSYVAIVTNNQDLITTAEHLRIQCYTVDQIKNGQGVLPTPPFNDNKVKINVSNNKHLEIPTKKLPWSDYPESDEHKKELNSATIHSIKNSNISTPSIENPTKYQSGFDKDKITSKNSSIFEIDGIEKLPQTGNPLNKGQSQESTLKSNWPQNKKQASIFEIDEFENQLQPVFDKEENKPKSSKQDSIFEIEKELNKKLSLQRSFSKEKPDLNSEHIIEIKKVRNTFLEKFLKGFYEKNRKNEFMVDERKSEIICSFTQIMEDCLGSILQNTEEELPYPPPWTLAEALACVSSVHSTHSYVRDVASVLAGVAGSGASAGDVIRAVGAGIACVKYLEFIRPNTAGLKETEDALRSILVFDTAVEDTGLEPKTPIFINEATDFKKNKQNFIKDRSEIIQYLKKNFAAWADFDETLEDATLNATRGMNKESTIVRTCGKNVGMLKLNQSKQITIEPNSSEHIEKHQNIHHDLNKDIKTELEDIDIENTVAKEFTNLKVTRIVNNISEPRDSKITSEKSNNATAEPKVVRLVSNIDHDKEKTKNITEMTIIDDTTCGHTFGTENNGTKVVRNIKPIKEFENKFKSQGNLDLDEIDWIISQSDDNNNVASESTNNNCMSMSLENNLNHDAKNDFDATNDNQHTTQNNSLNNEDCMTEILFETINIDDILAANNVNNNFDSNVFNYKNDNYDIDAINDDFKRLTHDSVENFDVLNDMMGENDIIYDGGLGNASQGHILVDSFLSDLNLAFKAMHMFLSNSANDLRGGQLSASASRIIRDTVTNTREHLAKIIENLDGIFQRECSNLTLKGLLTGPTAAGDERIPQYREIIGRCSKHAQLVDYALKTLLTAIDEQAL